MTKARKRVGLADGTSRVMCEQCAAAYTRTLTNGGAPVLGSAPAAGNATAPVGAGAGAGKLCDICGTNRAKKRVGLANGETQSWCLACYERQAGPAAGSPRPCER